MNEFQLEKLIWTEKDFDNMGWHDSALHSVAFFPSAFEFALDLDYIFARVNPEKEGGHYGFWVSPVTMVFESVSDIALNIDTRAGLEISEISRTDPKPTPNGKGVDWSWKIDCQEGDITLKAVGYKVYVRSNPVMQEERSIDLDNRGGVSFERKLAMAR